MLGCFSTLWCQACGTDSISPPFSLCVFTTPAEEGLSILLFHSRMFMCAQGSVQVYEICFLSLFWLSKCLNEYSVFDSSGSNFLSSRCIIFEKARDGRATAEMLYMRALPRSRMRFCRNRREFLLHAFNASALQISVYLKTQSEPRFPSRCTTTAGKQ